jgi:hypothetical protein
MIIPQRSDQVAIGNRKSAITGLLDTDDPDPYTPSLAQDTAARQIALQVVP